MLILKAINTTRNHILAQHVLLANNFFSRLKGLLFARPLAPDEGLFLLPCNSIHAIGMTYTIDAIFVNEQYVVVGIVENFKPWQISKAYWQAHGCLELPAGSIAQSGTILGDQLALLNLDKA